MKYRNNDIRNMVIRMVAILLVLALCLAGAGYVLAPKAADMYHKYQIERAAAKESKKLAEESAEAEQSRIDASKAAEESSKAEQSKVDASKAAEKASKEAKEASIQASIEEELASHDYNIDTGAYVNGSYMTYKTHHYTCYNSGDAGDKSESEYCKIQGGHLLSIDSEDEKRSVEEYLKYMGYSSSFSNGVTNDGYIICEWDN